MTATVSDQAVSGEIPREGRGQSSATKTVRRGLRRKHLMLTVGVVVIGLAAAWYAKTWWTVGRFVMTTDDAYVGGNVTPISPHVSGFVAQVLVADNQFVHAGQPLLRLDPVDFQAALDHARAVVTERQASLANLQAQLTLQHSTILESQAELVARKASAVFAAQDAARYQSLARTDAGSRQDAEKALATVQTAGAGVAAANARLAAAQQQLAVLGTQVSAAKAAIVEAEADLRQARLNLGYTAIEAPIDGFVADRSAQVGAYVSSGTNLLSVVPAAGLWVDANFKEDDIARMKPGDPATVAADVLPGTLFHGRVISLAPATGAIFSVIPPQNATGNFTKIVQRVPVRIGLVGDAAKLGRLRLGLSTTVSVDTRHDTTVSP